MAKRLLLYKMEQTEISAYFRITPLSQAVKSVLPLDVYLKRKTKQTYLKLFHFNI